jgi:hypothetical protein
MRIALLLGLGLLASCAAEKLALAPPSGVDMSGRWKLNEAESDDPQRLLLGQIAGPGPGASGSTGGQGGQGGRGGGRGGRGGSGGLGAGTLGGPSIPAVGALTEGLKWPGKQLEVKQVAGVVAMTSAGQARVYQPVADAHPRRRHKPEDDPNAPRDRDMRPRTQGDGPPPVCGWEGRTLVVMAGDPDEDHPPFEERYSLSEDGQRLVENIGFKGGRSGGFTMSRVWDREP